MEQVEAQTYTQARRRRRQEHRNFSVFDTRTLCILGCSWTYTPAVLRITEQACFLQRWRLGLYARQAFYQASYTLVLIFPLNSLYVVIWIGSYFF